MCPFKLHNALSNRWFAKNIGRVNDYCWICSMQHGFISFVYLATELYVLSFEKDVHYTYAIAKRGFGVRGQWSDYFSAWYETEEVGDMLFTWELVVYQVLHESYSAGDVSYWSFFNLFLVKYLHIRISCKYVMRNITRPYRLTCRTYLQSS